MKRGRVSEIPSPSIGRKKNRFISHLMQQKVSTNFIKAKAGKEKWYGGGGVGGWHFERRGRGL